MTPEPRSIRIEAGSCRAGVPAMLKHGMLACCALVMLYLALYMCAYAIRLPSHMVRCFQHEVSFTWSESPIADRWLHRCFLPAYALHRTLGGVKHRGER